MGSLMLYRIKFRFVTPSYTSQLVSALVKLFTPLFPPEVQARLKFERGPLEKVDDLMDISYGGKDRDAFLADLSKLCY